MCQPILRHPLPDCCSVPRRWQRLQSILRRTEKKEDIKNTLNECFANALPSREKVPQIHGLAADPRQVGMIPGRAPTQFRFQNSALVLRSSCCSQDKMLPRLHQAICQPLVCQVGHSRVVWHPVRHRGLEDFDRQLVIVDQIRIVVEEHGCEGLASTLNTTSNSPRMQEKTKEKDAADCAGKSWRCPPSAC